MNEQHTPGPWSVRRAMGGCRHFCITSASLERVGFFARREDIDLVVDLFNSRTKSKPDQETAAGLTSLEAEFLRLALLTEGYHAFVERQQMARGERYEHSSLLNDLRAAIAQAQTTKNAEPRTPLGEAPAQEGGAA